MELFCFVENTLPGQKVLASVNAKKHAECKLLEVIEKSIDEIDIPYQLIPGSLCSTTYRISESTKKRMFRTF